MASISVVINTLNEAGGLPKVIASVKNLADEIIVCDMESTDNTKEIAKKLGAKVFTHKRLSYVEPARNFGISKAASDWILILDVDEEISPNLAKKIIEIVKSPTADYYRIPRKNIIFGKWIEHTLWWPDYQIRLFRKGSVVWSEVIHSIPVTQGKGLDLPIEERYAIIHHNYDFVEQYIDKLNRYTTIQANLNANEFDWKDLIKKPTNEFINRYFEGKGYLDGVHGLVLSFLQSFSELVVVVKVWQKEKFKEQEPSKKEVRQELNKNIHDLKWWIRKDFSWFKNLVSR